MKGLILVVLVAICASGYASKAEESLVKAELLPWWPTLPPWWPSQWPTWPTKPTTTPKPNTCVHNQKYPYQSDCSKYQLCLSDTLFTINCPSTLHFHDAIQECDTPERARCTVTTDAPTTTTEEITTTTEDIITTTEGEEVTPACDNYRKYPYPDDCTKYQQCLNGILYVMDCPLTLHFHEEIQECNLPELAQCEITTTTTTDDVTTTTEEPSTPTPSTTTTSTTTTKPPNPGGVNCSLGGYHPHPTDCTKFYQCSNGVPHLMLCPAGLHWNTALTICDWPQAAKCTAG